MKKLLFLTACLLSLQIFVSAQDEEKPEKKPFKEHLFSGGSLSLAFYNNTFLIGGNPVLGYSFGRWADAGAVFNYSYTSYRDVYTFNDKLRQTIYGAGVFAKVYPVRFLFAQIQPEHNFIQQKYIPSNSGPTSKFKTDANSLLVGGGYTTGRDRDGENPFFYLAVLWDVSGNSNSPYTDAYGRTIPIIRTGFQIPLFRGHRNMER